MKSTAIFDAGVETICTVLDKPQSHKLERNRSPSHPYLSSKYAITAADCSTLVFMQAPFHCETSFSQFHYAICDQY